jgi:Xaa-Pro aminopeptidase
MTTIAPSPTLPALQVSSRIGQLRGRLADAGCDALLVTKHENVRYLTGFSGSAGMLLVTATNALLVTDGRYRDQAPEQLAEHGVESDVEIGRPDAQLEALGQLAKGTKRLGLESSDASWAFATRLDQQFAADLVATRGVVEALRVVKDDGELARLERACEIADIAFAQVKSRLAEEPSENDFAAELEYEMRKRGASGPSFETIVASGPNSALPHARPTERIVREGDLVVIDFGATYDGYHSDMTRTIFIGEPDVETRDLIESVLAAQRAGVRAVAVGASAGSVDEACRNSLTEAGLGELFTHSTGHGIGLQIHEAPAVAPGSADNLPLNTVIAVEPGAYIAGKGGVRIEDSVAVSAQGGRILTKSTKDYTL